MDPRQLEYFVQIANLGGFHRAADQLHIAQSALSRRVRLLEEELGVQLFERIGRGVRLTAAGELLRDKAQGVLRHMREVRDEVRAQSTVPQGELNIGMPPSLQSLLTVPLLERMRSLFPDVFMRTWVATSVELRDMLENGRIDLAVVGILDSEVGPKYAKLFADDMYLVGWKGAPGTKERSATWARIARLPLILTSRPNSVRLLVDAAAANQGHRLNVVIEANYVPVIIDLIIDRCGYTLLPWSAVSNLVRSRKLSAAKVTGLAYIWVIATSKNKPLSIAGERAREILLEIASTQ